MNYLSILQDLQDNECSLSEALVNQRMDVKENIKTFVNRLFDTLSPHDNKLKTCISFPSSELHLPGISFEEIILTLEI